MTELAVPNRAVHPDCRSDPPAKNRHADPTRPRRLAQARIAVAKFARTLVRCGPQQDRTEFAPQRGADLRGQRPRKHSMIAAACNMTCHDCPTECRQVMRMPRAKLGRLGLGRLRRRTGRQNCAPALTTATAWYREMDMHFWLEQAEDRDSAACISLRPPRTTTSVYDYEKCGSSVRFGPKTTSPGRGGTSACRSKADTTRTGRLFG